MPGWVTGLGAVRFRRNKNHNISDKNIMGDLSNNFQLLRWRSSIWKLVGRSLLLYTAAYFTISLILRLGFYSQLQCQETDQDDKCIKDSTFVKLVKFLRDHNSPTQLTFLLGFYVSIVVKRWWEQYVKLPWPDEVATFLKAAVTEKEEGPENTVYRETVLRYCLLSYILCVRRVSEQVKNVFPSTASLVPVGLITNKEQELIGEEREEDIHRHGGSNWWMPLSWSVDLLRRAQKEKRMVGPPVYGALVTRVCQFRARLTQVASYGHVTIPLVYTQVVHLAVYIYFGVELIASQYIKHVDGVDLYYPIFLSFQYLFFFGWLNVAKVLYNPYGCDDEDFEIMRLISRHIRVSSEIIKTEEAAQKLPELSFDDIDRIDYSKMFENKFNDFDGEDNWKTITEYKLEKRKMSRASSP